jgi:hypothetical protein
MDVRDARPCNIAGVENVYTPFCHSCQAKLWIFTEEAKAIAAWNRRAEIAATLPQDATQAAQVTSGPYCLKCGSTYPNAHHWSCSESGSAIAQPQAQPPQELCEDCPPVGYPTDETRCIPCPRRATQPPAQSDEPLDKYAHRMCREACTAWSDVKNNDGTLNEAKCQYAAAQEGYLRGAINELVAAVVSPQAVQVTAPFMMPVSADEINGECGYGSYKAFALFDANGKSVCDTLNSDLILLDEDADEDGTRRWDETGRKNMEHIAAVLNAAQPQAQPTVKEQLLALHDNAQPPQEAK